MEEQVLAARERIYQYKLSLCESAGMALISIGLNVPGVPKVLPESIPAVAYMTRIVDTALKRKGILPSQKEQIKSEDGVLGLLLVPFNAAELKALTTQIEDRHPVGRFFDLDVFDSTGKILSRNDTGAAPRTCYLCGEPARLCVRIHKHPTEQLRRYLTNRLHKFLEDELYG